MGSATSALTAFYMFRAIFKRSSAATTWRASKYPPTALVSAVLAGWRMGSVAGFIGLPARGGLLGFTAPFTISWRRTSAEPAHDSHQTEIVLMGGDATRAGGHPDRG